MDSGMQNYVCRSKAATKPFSFRWEIEQLPFRLAKVYYVFDSPEFEVGDRVPMFVHVTRQKNELSNNVESLAVYLWKSSKRPDEQVKVEFSVTVLNEQQPEKSVKKRQDSAIALENPVKSTSNGTYRSWGWQDVVPFASVVDKNGGFLKDGHRLTLVVEGVALVDGKHEIDVPSEIALGSEIGEDFGKLLDEGTLSDFVVKARNFAGVERDFKVHRNILTARSKFFAAMFSNPDVKECREGVLEVEDVDSGTMEALLRFLYTGKCPQLSDTESDENVEKDLGLLIAADKYEVLGLKNHLERVLAAKLSVENVCECFVLATRHSAPFLAARCKEFARGKAREVGKTDGWRELCTPENAELAADLFAP